MRRRINPKPCLSSTMKQRSRRAKIMRRMSGRPLAPSRGLRQNARLPKRSSFCPGSKGARKRPRNRRTPDRVPRLPRRALRLRPEICRRRWRPTSSQGDQRLRLSRNPDAMPAPFGCNISMRRLSNRLCLAMPRHRRQIRPNRRRPSESCLDPLRTPLRLRPGSTSPRPHLPRSLRDRASPSDGSTSPCRHPHRLPAPHRIRARAASSHTPGSAAALSARGL